MPFNGTLSRGKSPLPLASQGAIGGNDAKSTSDSIYSLSQDSSSYTGDTETALQQFLTLNKNSANVNSTCILFQLIPLKFQIPIMYYVI